MSMPQISPLPQAEDCPDSAVAGFFPGYEPGEPVLPPAEIIEIEATLFLTWDNELGDLLCETLRQLARDFTSTRATNVRDFRARRELLLDWAAQAVGGLR